MTKACRIAVAVAALLLLTVYVLPLWRIQLRAPQYPEGLGLEIWASQIRGIGPNDLQNINGLNHYIGMARIEPDQIPELRYMPFVVAGLIAFGLVTAVWGNRKLLYAYAATFVVVAVAGLYDFWKWEYEYGHNLDPSAAIQIPGMTYQPPLIGGKALLNFYASSWPGPAGIAAMISAAIVALAAILAWRGACRHAPSVTAPTPRLRETTA
jgi:copper chaperone NosL